MSNFRNPLEFFVFTFFLLCAKIGGWNMLFLTAALFIGLGIWIGRSL